MVISCPKDFFGFSLYVFLFSRQVHATPFSSPRYTGKPPRLETNIWADLTEKFSFFSLGLDISQEYSVNLANILHKTSLFLPSTRSYPYVMVY